MDPDATTIDDRDEELLLALDDVAKAPMSTFVFNELLFELHRQEPALHSRTSVWPWSPPAFTPPSTGMPGAGTCVADELVYPVHLGHEVEACGFSVSTKSVADRFWRGFLIGHNGDPVDEGQDPVIAWQIAMNEAARMPLYHLRGRRAFVAQYLEFDLRVPTAEPTPLPCVGVLIAPEDDHTLELLEVAAIGWLRELCGRAGDHGGAHLIHY